MSSSCADTRRARRRHRPSTATIALLSAALSAGAGTGSRPVEPAGPPPETVPASVRAMLLDDGFVVRDGATVARVWMRELPALTPHTGDPLGVNFPRLNAGGMVGLLVLDTAWSDYRGAAVPQGSYTLRYLPQPEDGNHTGTTVYRDFLILVPADGDRHPARSAAPERLLELGREASGEPHPFVLGLFPVGEVPEPPQLVENELGQRMLPVRLGPLQLGLVFRGGEPPDGF